MKIQLGIYRLIHSKSIIDKKTAPYVDTFVTLGVYHPVNNNVLPFYYHISEAAEKSVKEMKLQALLKERLQSLQD